MHLANQTYDWLKWLVLVFLPALAVLLAGLGELYQIADINLYVQTLNLITVFIGTLLQISSSQYWDDSGPSGGTLTTGSLSPSL